MSLPNVLSVGFYVTHIERFVYLNVLKGGDVGSLTYDSYCNSRTRFNSLINRNSNCRGKGCIYGGSWEVTFQVTCCKNQIRLTLIKTEPP